MQEEAQNPLCVIEILALLYLTRKKFGQGFPLPLCLKYDNSKMSDHTWQSSSFLSVIPKKEIVVSMDKVKIQNSDI